MSILIAGKMFTIGRIIFMILFVVAFGVLIFFSYKKDTKNHKLYYKSTGLKVLFYGILIIIVFISFRLLTGNFLAT